ncbi:hypothetical protein RhiirB3_427642 [Rhizophagus irregularis]|nr:hypothetical protein RhiirB3_427642 [Rhizophagus irregularis]
MKQQLPAIKEWIENIRLPSNGKAAGPSQISIKRDKEYAEELYSRNTMKDYYYDIDRWMIKINNFYKYEVEDCYKSPIKTINDTIEWTEEIKQPWELNGEFTWSLII